MKGTIKAYYDDRRFGFITGEDDASYFFHEDDCLMSGLSKGNIVEFEPSSQPKGLRAKNVKLVKG